jgi:hypothetical protein
MRPRRGSWITHPRVRECDGQTVEHAFGTLKAWMGATHFPTNSLPKVRTEMSLHVCIQPEANRRLRSMRSEGSGNRRA